MIDQRTAHLALPLPHPANTLAEDVGRLIQALQRIDAAIAAESAACQSAIAAESAARQSAIQAIDGRLSVIEALVYAAL